MQCPLKEQVDVGAYLHDGLHPMRLHPMHDWPTCAQAEGLKNAQLEKDLIPVQKAVIKLAKAGEDIEKGDVR